MRTSLILCANYSSGAPSPQQPAAQPGNVNPTQWPGGRACLATVAAAYPTTSQLQMLGPDGATWLNVGSNVTANALTAAQDLPAGQYRMNFALGTATGVYATIVGVPYD